MPRGSECLPRRIFPRKSSDCLWKNEKLPRRASFFRAFRRQFLRDTAGKWPPCLHERTFDSQRTSSGCAARCPFRVGWAALDCPSDLFRTYRIPESILQNSDDVSGYFPEFDDFSVEIHGEDSGFNGDGDGFALRGQENGVILGCPGQGGGLSVGGEAAAAVFL